MCLVANLIQYQTASVRVLRDRFVIGRYSIPQAAVGGRVTTSAYQKSSFESCRCLTSPINSTQQGLTIDSDDSDVLKLVQSRRGLLLQLNQ